jgi:hypothetical protein
MSEAMEKKQKKKTYSLINGKEWPVKYHLKQSNINNLRKRR